MYLILVHTLLPLAVITMFELFSEKLYHILLRFQYILSYIRTDLAPYEDHKACMVQVDLA